MLVVKAMLPMPSQDMRSDLGYIPESNWRELLSRPNGQREFSFVLSLGGVKQEILRIEASAENVSTEERGMKSRLN